MLSLRRSTKIGLKESTVVYALRNWLILIFSKTTEVSSSQVHTSVTPEGIYICTGNDVIRYFRSTANRVHATAAVTNFTVLNGGSRDIRTAHFVM